MFLQFEALGILAVTWLPWFVGSDGWARWEVLREGWRGGGEEGGESGE